MVRVGDGVRGGRATEVVEEEGGRGDKVVWVERALYKIGV